MRQIYFSAQHPTDLMAIQGTGVPPRGVPPPRQIPGYAYARRINPIPRRSFLRL